MKVNRETFTVYQSHLQPNGILSVPAIASFMQEAAWANVKDIGFSTEELFQKDLAWVLTKMHWDFLDIAQHRDEITVETWPSGNDKYFFYRDFRLYKEESLLAQITTTWILISLKSRQLKAVPESLSKLSFSHQKEAMVRASKKITLPEEFQIIKKQLVNWHHLDVNKHTNHTLYIQWLLDTLPNNTIDKKTIKSFDINFKTESKEGDLLSIQTASNEQKPCVHAIFNQNGKELVRAITEWA